MRLYLKLTHYKTVIHYCNVQVITVYPSIIYVLLYIIALQHTPVCVNCLVVHIIILYSHGFQHTAIHWLHVDPNPPS